MAEDIDVLEQYLTSHGTKDTPARRAYSRVTHGSGESTLYLAVPRWRKGLKIGHDPGRAQREVMEQVLRPHMDEIITLYFNNVHPCFPILDETNFWDLWRREQDRISSALMCVIYALALLYWHTSERLRDIPQPDAAFAWNQAVAAMHEDFLAPSMTTIHAALLDLSGRPILAVISNIMTAGRTTMLAHSLGLHRDPSRWNTSEVEKGLRIRLWWGVIIHDYWSSLAHGTPHCIQPANHDVPLPRESLITPAMLESHKRACSSFIHLCSLTQILGDILPLVYNLHANQDDVSETIRRLECKLDDWEDNLPGFLRYSNNVERGEAYVNGSSSLWFCFLFLKLVLCRLAFRQTLLEQEIPLEEAKNYRMALLRESACNLVDYVISVHKAQLHEFWLSYISHLLVTATTILLRCTVECSNDSIKRNCAGKLVKLMERLELARSESNWDLADFCLERCQQPADKVATALATDPGDTSAGSNDIAMQDPSSYNTDDIFLTMDSDDPWSALWDHAEGPWLNSI